MSSPGGRDGNIDPEWVIREAVSSDVMRICAFGDAHVRAHYAPLIGTEAAAQQVSIWWNPLQIGAAVSGGLIVIAEVAGDIIGVAQRGRNGADHVLYKLYLDPASRGRGLGPALIDAVIQRLPAATPRLCVEHFAGNARAAAFYERERFFVERVDHSEKDAALDVVWRARTL